MCYVKQQSNYTPIKTNFKKKIAVKILLPTYKHRLTHFKFQLLYITLSLYNYFNTNLTNHPHSASSSMNILFIIKTYFSIALKWKLSTRLYKIFNFTYITFSFHICCHSFILNLFDLNS